MSDSMSDLTEAPPSRSPIAAVITGGLLALPGLWVLVSSIGFEGHDALDATVVVAWWGAAGGTLAGVPAGVFVARKIKSPVTSVIAGTLAGGVAWGVGAALAVSMLLGMAT